MTMTKGNETIDKVKEAYDLIEQGIKNITNSEDYKKFLQFSSRFYNYSLNNQLLIWIQKPNATFVAGFGTWKKLGRHVRKGEKGIKILAPMHVKATKKNDDGEDEVIEYNRYRTISVFDISQTEGEHIPSLREFVQNVSGETELYEMMKNISPFPVEELDDCEGADGYFNHSSQEIRIWSKNSTSHRLLTLVHEIAHGLLHNDRKNVPNKKTREIEAESVGFVVCHALGIDTSANSLGYMACYGGNSTIEFVEGSKERIHATARTIISNFEKAYMSKEEDESWTVA